MGGNIGIVALFPHNSTSQLLITFTTQLRLLHLIVTVAYEWTSTASTSVVVDRCRKISFSNGRPLGPTEHHEIFVRYLSFLSISERVGNICWPWIGHCIKYLRWQAALLVLLPFGIADDVHDVTGDVASGHVPGYFRCCLRAAAGLPGSELFRPIIAVILYDTLTT